MPRRKSRVRFMLRTSLVGGGTFALLDSGAPLKGQITTRPTNTIVFVHTKENIIAQGPSGTYAKSIHQGFVMVEP